MARCATYEPEIAINRLAHVGRRPLSRRRSLLCIEGRICIWRSMFQAIKARLSSRLAHAEGYETAVRQCSDSLVARLLFLSAPFIQGHHLLHIGLRMCRGHDLDHIRTMIHALLHDRLERLERIRALEIVVRPDEYGTVFMGGLTHPLRHLLLRLKLHIDISRAGLNRPHEPFLRDLHRLDLTALRGHCGVLQRRFVFSGFRYTAGRHKRDVRREKFICLPGSQLTAVQTDLRHLTLFQSSHYLLVVPVLYCCTNHNLYFINLQTSSTVRATTSTSPIAFGSTKWTFPPSAFLSFFII